jgi:5-(carboxyamino)imidazole ribonucleotide synthase
LPGYHPVDSKADLEEAATKIGLPLVLKTRRLGYDGKGQFVVKTVDDITTAWQQLGGAELIAEQWVNFDYEVSAIGARNRSGDIINFPLTQNQHIDGILHASRAPVEDELLTRTAGQYLQRLVEELDYVGVLALELFVTGDQLVANEFAPRVHNSGHWSIEAAQPSQFTAHLLAITDASLTAPVLNGYAGMLNLIGDIPEAARHLQSGTLHDYGKEPRPGRKLGHITVIAETMAERERLFDEIEQNVT